MKKREQPETGTRVRINRYLSMCGVTSRRKAEALILEGKVKVNDRIVTDLSTKVDPVRDRVFVNGSQAVRVHEYVYFVLNKPKDTITTVSDERGRPTVMSLIRSKHRVFPIGRLDRNTTGVLLFTNDGAFANGLMHPRREVPKAYHVTCEKAVSREDLALLKRGLVLADGPATPSDLFVVPGGKGKEIGIVIHEGRNRQVRRMFEKLGYEVAKLDRVAYGPVTREALPRGAMRSLTHAELRQLRTLAGIDEPD
jgi:23S rRNA pseudouridine2605 synthase